MLQIFTEVPSQNLKYNGLFQKKTKRWIEDILFLKLLPGYLGFLLHPWKSQTNQGFTGPSPLETLQTCVAPLGNFKPENQEPWKFHIILVLYFY